MMRGKKDRERPYQRLALERIYRLFELAEKGGEYSKRYVELAQRIGTKTRVKIPKELKKKYCRKCLGMKVEAKEKDGFLVVKCGECGFEKKYRAEKK